MTAALIQSNDRYSVHLYEKRREYSRTRMVQLAPYLVADSAQSYCSDYIDGESLEAIFSPSEIAEVLAFRQSIPADLMGLLREWTVGFCPLKHIEQSLSDLIDTRRMNPVRRASAAVSLEEAGAMLEPGDVLIDCTGTKSVVRDSLVPGAGSAEGANTYRVHLEYALVVTFLYSQPYDCNEHCKYYKNIENVHYKFIPAVQRTCYDGRISHVTGIVNIPAEDYERMPSRFGGEWLRLNVPEAARSMDNFIKKVRTETNGEVVGDLEIVRIPLDLYRARNATSLPLWRADAGDHPFARSPVFLAGDSAMGSPYFQSISLGFECAMFLTGLLAEHGLPLPAMERYERFTYRQWLRVYLRTKMIKHNKDLFEIVGDTFALLDKLHIY